MYSTELCCWEFSTFFWIWKILKSGVLIVFLGKLFKIYAGCWEVEYSNSNLETQIFRKNILKCVLSTSNKPLFLSRTITLRFHTYFFHIFHNLPIIKNKTLLLGHRCSPNSYNFFYLLRFGVREPIIYLILKICLGKLLSKWYMNFKRYIWYGFPRLLQKPVITWCIILI